ncbi:MAG: AAA family ATPase [Verrucomicrobia bacterium]|nr:AAA family ATPase [Verrucomicrobiota bacterium]
MAGAPSGYAYETLRADEEFSLCRVRQEGKPSTFLVVAPVSEYPSLGSLARLEHAYSLRGELDSGWAVRPVALNRQGGRVELVLEDPGPGVEGLDWLLGAPMEPGRFLRLGINLAAGLGKLHQRGLIHKDVNPFNILVAPPTARVWFTGFGFASRLRREQQTADPPEVIAGTLAYMAPEQTGRMNRSIDSRSDLYSLGITLYQMLTGTLPFEAADSMGWVHCHVARPPPSPSERLAAVPEPISAIVLKLLAKTAEERYQTAAGLETDLRKCLLELERTGRIDAFPLGQGDVPDRLLIPEKLYGRHQECQVLLDAFERVVASGRPELILVTGYSGIGKSALVNELQKLIGLPRGTFICGKFEQAKRDVPYAALAQAFQPLVRQILVKSEDEVNSWKSLILEAVAPNGQLMINLIPELELVIGPQPAVPDLPHQQSKIRFEGVLRAFVGIFAHNESTLALFLDDLQWLDSATLQLLELLITDSGIRHLLLIGAYRDNELVDRAEEHRLKFHTGSAGASRWLEHVKRSRAKGFSDNVVVAIQHPLALMLGSLRNSEAIVHEVVLNPLSLADVNHLLGDALRCEFDYAAPLAELVHEKTRGNPFFTIQFLANLAEEHLLEFDLDTVRWRWDIDRIRSKGFTDNVVRFLIGKLNRLPAATQETLKQLACLGNGAETATLSLVQGVPENHIHAALWDAVQEGLVLRQDNVYAFLNDRVQEAAYALIPESQRAAVHLRIARLLVSQVLPEQKEEKIFEIVNQFNRSSALIDSVEEREQIAKFNLLAGMRAKKSTAYASSLIYFISGRELLAADSWEQQYPITFALELQRAECEFLTGNFTAAEERLSMLSHYARDLPDSAAVARLQTELYGALDRSDCAVAAGLNYLRRAGINLPQRPTNDEVRQEYEEVLRQLGNQSIESLLDLPAMTDPVCRATVDVLTAVEAHSFLVNQDLRCFVVARIVNLSLKYGNSDGSCVAYVQLGWLVAPRFGDYHAAFRFGQLGLDLVEKRGLERFRARVSQCFAYFISPWSRPLQNSLELVRRSFVSALETGDLKYAVFCGDRLITLLLSVGHPLSEVQKEAETRLEFTQRAKFKYVADIIIGNLKFIRALRGLTSSLSSFHDGEFDESRFEQDLRANSNSLFAGCWYWIRKLQALYYADQYDSALVAASMAEPLLQAGPGHFERAEYTFFTALAQAANYDSASAEQKAQYSMALATHYDQIAVWAKNCPENFGNRAALVAAEIARIEGRALDAQNLYEKAIRSAREHGFIQNEAIAHEVAARFYSARGFETIANAYLRNARYCYLRWGAAGKVEHLDQRYPVIAQEASLRSTVQIVEPVRQLDLETVTKASQAISSEIVLEKLIETLLIIALQHGAAERALLILQQGDDQQIAAEARSVRDKIAVDFRESTLEPSELPESLIRYVIRTQERVILSDASSDNIFSEDEYIRQKRPRSVLCLPLIKRRSLIGTLYLENNLAPNVFALNRLAALELIASQAAISLAQAGLYAELTHANEELKAEIAERRRAEEALRQKEASLREAQTGLAHASRLTTMGEMAASIAHELNQPLAGMVTNANASLRWLAGASPNFAEAREAIGRVVRDGTRAGDVVARLRALFKKADPAKEAVNINEAIEEVVVLTQSEVRRNKVLLRMDLAANLPPVTGDRVQIQQVALNLILNAIEAMSTVDDRERELIVGTKPGGDDQIRVMVKDSGIGFDPLNAERIFDAFHTTKPGGLGLGLAISRSIVEWHGGRLWAVSNNGPGATFQFTLSTIK